MFPLGNFRRGVDKKYNLVYAINTIEYLSRAVGRVLAQGSIQQPFGKLRASRGGC